MSSNKFVFDGLEELKRELRNLPVELTTEGSREVEGSANGAAVAVKSAYGAHRHTGHLQDSVIVEHRQAGEFAAAAIVKATAKHAYIFENGTEARHYITVNGVRHETGKMPAANAFIPAMIRARRAMYQKLKDLLVRNGLSVSGEDG